MEPERPAVPAPAALTIAGSDPTGGAGIQADLQAFAARGVRGGAVITALTVQSGGKVQRVEAVDPGLVADQLEAALLDVAPMAVKCGMLRSAGVVHAVHRVLERFPELPLVVDPVLASGGGTSLMEDKGQWALCEVLLPRTDLLTPNALEASMLSRMPVRNEDEAREAAVTLQALGARAVLVKGGHLPDGPAQDILFDGSAFHVFEAPRLDLGRTHGTGCLLSALITAELARGLPLVLAVAQAKRLLLGALEAGGLTPTGLRIPDVLKLREDV